MNEFREILNELISETGYSLRELAKKSDVSAMQYSRYLRGSIPTIKVIIKIAKYFDCSLDYLFGLSINKTNSKYITYEYDMTGFVDRYKKILIQNNISNFKFAKNNIFNESIMRHWKAGAIPRMDIIYIIAKELNVSIDELIGRF